MGATQPYRASGLGACRLPPGFAAELGAELEPGERVLWTGRPRKWSLLRKGLSELWVPLLYNGFVVALVAMCSGGRLSLAAAPLLAFGLPLFQAPLGAWRSMRAMFYAVTDRRALVFDADGIWVVERGDIVEVRVRASDVSLFRRRAPTTTLVGVPDAREVLDALRAS
ncbi:MAG TPA: hypothetical protein VGG39_16965 [Polyangiaceae bacterium]